MTSASPAPALPPAPPGKPAADDPTPTNDAPPAAPSSSAATPPPPPADAGAPPPTGTCTNPTCTAGGPGSFRCRATDGNGSDVQLDCENGDCACFTSYDLTTELPGDIADVGDARTFFFANCQCY